MFRSVMIPADFSDNTGSILEFAEGLSALGVKRVVLGHAVDAVGMEGPVIAKTMDKVRSQVRDMATGLTDAGLNVEVRVATGEITNALLGIAAEAHVDLVVAGTHGKGALTKLFAGSVSEDLVTNSSVPSLMVRYDLLKTREHASDITKGFARQLLMPTDFSASSMKALTSIFELPRQTVGTLYLLHVIESGLSGEKLRKSEEGAEFQLNNMINMAAENGVSAKAVIKQGDPKRVVLQEANERRVSGMVLGNRGIGTLQEVVLGSVSLTLMRQASCPVMIVS